MSLPADVDAALIDFFQHSGFRDSGGIVTDLDGTAVHEENGRILIPKPVEFGLKAIYDPRPEKIIFIKGDPGVKYQDVIDAMDIARGSGVKVIGVPPKDIGKEGAPAAK